MRDGDGLSREPLDDIEALYRSAYGRFLRLATSIVGDVDGARDVVQDAFASAILHRRAYRGTGTLEGWLWRTVTNTALNHRRRAGRTLASNGAGPDPGWPDGTDDALVRDLVAGLPERQRHALFLRHYADLDYRMIADVLNVKPGTVAASLSAAHASLRAALVERAG